MNYLFNFYRYTRFKDFYLVTLDDGSFRFFNESAFKQIKRGKIEDNKLYQELRDFGLIIDETNIVDMIKRQKKRYMFLGNGTSLHIIVPTMRCNLRCAYCFANSNTLEDHETPDMDKETAKKTVEFLMKTPSNAVTIEFQGGECLLNTEIIKTINEEAKKLNEKYKKDLRMTVVTNLTAISNELIDYLIENQISICTSLDGPREVHDKNRYYLNDHKIVGTYDIVTKNIDKINQKYKDKGSRQRVNALPTISKYSIPYYKEIIDEYVKREVTMYDVRFITDLGRALDNSHVKADIQKYIQFWKDSVNYIGKLKEQGIKIQERMMELYYTKIIKNLPGFHTEYESPCGAISGQMLYYPDGSIYTCNEGMNNDDFKIGNVWKDTWKGLFKKKEVGSFIINSMIESNPWCDTCAYKPYCSTCQIENFYNFGKLDFYPTKTKRHHFTKQVAETYFTKLYNNITIQNDNS